MEPKHVPLIEDVQELEGFPTPGSEQGTTSVLDPEYLLLCADRAKTICFHAAPKALSVEGRPSDTGVTKRARSAGAAIKALLTALHKGETGPKEKEETAASSEAVKQESCTLPGSLVAPLYVFARTHIADKPWTDRESRAQARDILAGLLRASRCGSIAELLRGHREGERGVFEDVMVLLKPQLKKDTWELNPATKNVFSSTLHQVTRPWLSDFLESVLPPSLLISDDHRTENKILGVSCLHHIIRNVPAADLLQYNRLQVVYHALFNHLYTPEADLIQAVLSCLLDLLPVLERSAQVTRGPSQRIRYCDDVFQLILTQMEMEPKILLRRVYAKHLPMFVERLNIGVVRHLKRLERVLLGYLEVYDGPEETSRLAILETMKCTIMHAWPRIPCRLLVLLKALLRFIYDVATDCSLTPPHVKSDMLQEATHCLILLDRCSERQIKDILEGISHACTEPQVLQCLEKVQQDV
ncbi:TELO2-interacting protein 2 [Ambystoma mexicanum]|uniref:TELO2-interacting protein 2 n=1 Tax=Ambystoma mexicanum TaxID=8296 RepID=UPI0037E9124A